MSLSLTHPSGWAKRSSKGLKLNSSLVQGLELASKRLIISISGLLQFTCLLVLDLKYDKRCGCHVYHAHRLI